MIRLELPQSEIHPHVRVSVMHGDVEVLSSTYDGTHKHYEADAGVEEGVRDGRFKLFARLCNKHGEPDLNQPVTELVLPPRVWSGPVTDPFVECAARVKAILEEAMVADIEPQPVNVEVVVEPASVTPPEVLVETIITPEPEVVEPTVVATPEVDTGPIGAQFAVPRRNVEHHSPRRPKHAR